LDRQRFVPQRYEIKKSEKAAKGKK
jgi:hypothetical protein